MKKTFPSLCAAAFAAGATLASCSTSSDPSIVAEQALTAAHSAHDALALSASAAANSGTCTNACATQVKTALDKSEALLVAADGLSNPSDIQADVAAAVAILETIKAELK